MPAPDLAFVKSWARIDGAEFDVILPGLVAAATALASHETGVDYTVEAMPDAAQLWVAANVSYWIKNPDAAEAGSMQPSPFLDRLLDPCRLRTMEVRVVV